MQSMGIPQETPLVLMTKKTRPDLGTSKWKAIRKQVLQRDQHTCYVCGNEANQVDHIIAKVNGGTEDLGNLGAICAKCNALKGSTVDRPRPNNAAMPSRFLQQIPPTRSSARLSLPKPESSEGNPFQ